MQTLLAPIPSSRSPFARLSVQLRRSLRRVLSRLRRLARAASGFARAGIDHLGRLGSLATLSSLARDPAIEAWLALGREVRRRRQLAGLSAATAPKPPLPREGARILLLRSGERPTPAPPSPSPKSRDARDGHDSHDDHDGIGPLNLRITM